MKLSEAEKRELIRLIEADQPLPARYQATLFAEPQRLELIWEGKTTEVTTAVLPFQSIEQIDEARDEGKPIQNLLFPLGAGGRQAGGWSNKLIWGDNKLILSSLKNGPMRREIEEAGGLKLIYIDPPFDVGADFSFDVEVGGETLTKEPSVIEEIAYRDTWGRGADSYAAMIYERLKLMKDLLADDGSIYVHCDFRVNAHIRLCMDEIFGGDKNVNEIVWKRSDAKGDAAQGSKHYPRLHDTILFYAKTENKTWNVQYLPLSDHYVESFYKYKDETGRPYKLENMLGPGGPAKGNPVYEVMGVTRAWRYSRQRMQQLIDEGLVIQTRPGTVPMQKKYLDESKGKQTSTWWDDISMIRGWSGEKCGYVTQKPEALLERILKVSSNPGDLVADFFCGSGTTLAVAEKLGRKWIGCDLGRFAIHTSRKRLIGVQRQLKAADEPYRSFEILNLGKYERQYFVGINPNLSPEERERQSLQKEEHYFTLILFAYQAQRVFNTPPFHGHKGGRFVLVGPLDAPVTQSQLTEAVSAAKKLKATKVDVLGFEFEMGSAPYCQDLAKQGGVTLALKYIPRDVFDRRAVESGQVKFLDVAYLEAEARVVGEKGGLSVRVALKDFGVFYRHEDLDEVMSSLGAGKSKVVLDQGQVWKVTNKNGEASRELLTEKWEDWIDYWAVDFDYESRQEIIRRVEDGPAGPVEREEWTGNYIFENEWQSFRTRQTRALELVSAPHAYPAKGRYKVAVKVIDIFGNDTTKVIEVKL
ncbi:MAG: site-specific DNA-methyltransferase [Deltaproteobacteria bacterium]|nr:site-specific DNA-methyltransferase [Deltaproteobacteria bacterium]